MKQKTRYKNFGNNQYRLLVHEWPLYRYRPQKAISVELWSKIQKNIYRMLHRNSTQSFKIINHWSCSCAPALKQNANL